MEYVGIYSKKLKADASNLAASLITVKRRGVTVEKHEEIRGDRDQYGTAEDHTRSLPIMVRASPNPQQDTPMPTTTLRDKKGVPGFERLLLSMHPIKRK